MMGRILGVIWDLICILYRKFLVGEGLDELEVV